MYMMRHNTRDSRLVFIGRFVRRTGSSSGHFPSRFISACSTALRVKICAILAFWSFMTILNRNIELAKFGSLILNKSSHIAHIS